MASEGHANRDIPAGWEHSRPRAALASALRHARPAVLAEDAPGVDASADFARESATHCRGHLACQPPAATHWSVRACDSQALARQPSNAFGCSRPAAASVKTFKLSRDQRFVEKLTDCGRTLSQSSDKALVLCVDEKSQIQAWIAPSRSADERAVANPDARLQTKTHDHAFAALKCPGGTVIGHCMPRHRHQEFLKFFGTFNGRLHPARFAHVLDNYGTHKHPVIQSW